MGSCAFSPSNVSRLVRCVLVYLPGQVSRTCDLLLTTYLAANRGE